MAVGKPSTPTPPGRFWIRELFKIGSPASGYYPYAFGTADYSTLSEWPRGGIVGIHGPYYDPGGIPGAMLRLSTGGSRLGRSADNTIQLPDASISRYHAFLGADEKCHAFLAHLSIPS